MLGLMSGIRVLNYCVKFRCFVLFQFVDVDKANESTVGRPDLIKEERFQKIIMSNKYSAEGASYTCISE